MKSLIHSQNIHGITVKVWEWISSFSPHLDVHRCDHWSMLGQKLNHISKRGSCWENLTNVNANDYQYCMICIWNLNNFGIFHCVEVWVYDLHICYHIGQSDWSCSFVPIATAYFPVGEVLISDFLNISHWFIHVWHSNGWATNSIRHERW